MNKQLEQKYEELITYMSNFIDEKSIAGKIVSRRKKEILALKSQESEEITQECKQCGNTSYKELHGRECGNNYPHDSYWRKLPVSEPVSNGNAEEMKSVEDQYQKSLRLLDKFIKEIPKEELAKMIADVDAMDIEGPTVAEYFALFASQSHKEVTLPEEGKGAEEMTERKIIVEVLNRYKDNLDVVDSYKFNTIALDVIAELDTKYKARYCEKISTEQNPEFAGWYDTDKGELFWFKQETVWSCRDEYVSEEYPKFWYLPAKSVTDDLRDELIGFCCDCNIPLPRDKDYIDLVDGYLSKHNKPTKTTDEDIKTWADGVVQAPAYWNYLVDGAKAMRDGQIPKK